MAFAEHDRQHTSKPEETKDTPKAILHPAPTAPKIHKVAVKHVSSRAHAPQHAEKTIGKPAEKEENVIRTDARIDESLRSIYEDEEGNMPDMTKLEHRRNRGWLAALVGFLAVGLLTGAGYVGYLVFSPYVLNADARVEVTLSAPDSVAAFADTSIDITYENIGTSAVQSGEMRLNIPPEFVVTSTDPLPTSDPATWAIRTLAPGEEQQITLKGYFIAERGARGFLQGVMRYSPQGMNTVYEDISTKTVTITESELDVTLDAPAEAVSGEVTSLTFKVHNGASRRIDQVVLTPRFPPSFLLSSSLPELDTAGRWNIGALEPDQTAKVTVKGAFSTNHADSETLGAVAGVRVREGVTGIAEQATAVAPIRIASSAFVLRTLINGSADDQHVDFGGKLRMSTMYKNNGNAAMKDIVLTMTLDGTPNALIDWAAFDTETKADTTFSRKGETITVNKKLFPAFAELAPGTEGTFTWTLPLLKTATEAETYQVKVSTQATIGTIGTKKVTKSVQTTPFTVTPNSNLELRTGAYYFTEDDAPIGSGPLPPIVGKETRYMVAWKLSNTVHELKDITVKTQLAEGVAWTGKTSSQGGGVLFDEASRTVTWTVPVMKTDSHVYTAEFEIGLTPTESQVDSFAPLTTGATLVATDTVTKAILTRTTQPDTTELPRDPGAKDKGLVTEDEER